MAKKVVNKRKKVGVATEASTLDVKELEQAHADGTLDQIADIEKEHMGDPELQTGIYHPESINLAEEDTAKVLGLDLSKGNDYTAKLQNGELCVIENVPQEVTEKIAEELARTPMTVTPLTPFSVKSVSKINEAVVNIAGSTPAKDFAVSVCKFFETHPNACLRVRYIGAGSGQQLTKATIEANKLLVPRGQMISRFDFWTNENDKSVNNVRLVVVDIFPNSLAQALTGDNVEYINLEAFLHKEGGTK